MAHAESLEALVLKTYDVGEADRFCILFTREHGRIAAKASGARRVKSRLGGTVLPYRHLELRATESRSGWVITSAVLLRDVAPATHDLHRFTALQEITELLLRLVPHEGSLPDVFDATAAFFAGEEISSRGFTLRLLHLLGLLPGDQELSEFFHLGAAECRYVEGCRQGAFTSEKDCDIDVLERLKTLILEPHLSSPLKAPALTSSLR